MLQEKFLAVVSSKLSEDILRVRRVECHFECHCAGKIGKRAQTLAEIRRRQTVAVPSLTLNTPVFIGVFVNGFKESHSLRQFNFAVFLSILHTIIKRQILSATASSWAEVLSDSVNSLAEIA